MLFGVELDQFVMDYGWVIPEEEPEDSELQSSGQELFCRGWLCFWTKPVSVSIKGVPEAGSPVLMVPCGCHALGKSVVDGFQRVDFLVRQGLLRWARPTYFSVPRGVRVSSGLCYQVLL